MSLFSAIAIRSKKSKARDECPSAAKTQRKESGDRSQEIKKTNSGKNSEFENPEFRRSILRCLVWRYFLRHLRLFAAKIPESVCGVSRSAARKLTLLFTLLIGPTVLLGEEISSKLPDDRVVRLLGQMTLEEKIAQLHSVLGNTSGLYPVRTFSKEIPEPLLEHGAGWVWRVTTFLETRDAARSANELQRKLETETRQEILEASVSATFEVMRSGERED